MGTKSMSGNTWFSPAMPQMNVKFELSTPICIDQLGQMTASSLLTTRCLVSAARLSMWNTTLSSGRSKKNTPPYAVHACDTALCSRCCLPRVRSYSSIADRFPRRREPDTYIRQVTEYNSVDTFRQGVPIVRLRIRCRRHSARKTVLVSHGFLVAVRRIDEYLVEHQEAAFQNRRYCGFNPIHRTSQLLRHADSQLRIVNANMIRLLQASRRMLSR